VILNLAASFSNTRKSSKSRIDANVDFLEPAQSPPPICFNYGEFAFFLPSGWLGWLSFALAPIRLLPDYTGNYHNIIIIPHFLGISGMTLRGREHTGGHWQS